MEEVKDNAFPIDLKPDKLFIFTPNYDHLTEILQELIKNQRKHQDVLQDIQGETNEYVTLPL